MARRMRRLVVLAGVVAIPLALWAVLPIASTGAPTSKASRLQGKIDAKRKLRRRRPGEDD